MRFGNRPSGVAVLTFLTLACTHSGSLPDTPLESHDPLSWLIGEWHGTRFEPSSGEQASVVSRVKPILGGLGQEEALEIETSKGTYRGLYLQLAERDNSKSVIIYVNSNRRSFTRLEGTADSDGGEWLNVAIQGSHRSRLVYERPSPTAWRRTQYVSDDSGQTWTVLWVDDLHLQSRAR